MTDLSTKINKQLEQTDQYILNHVKSYPSTVTKFISKIIKAGGKRLRPKICLAFAHAYEIDQDLAISLAASIEILHLATLIHDDLIDNGNLRRGIVPIHKQIGATSTVLFGDLLFALAAKLVSINGTNQMLKAFAETVETIAKGELEKSLNKNTSFNKKDVLSISYAKTGVLYELSAKISLLNNQSKSDEIENAIKFGRNFGIAYQLIDDLIDLGVTTINAGKSLNSDIQNETYTLPIIYYFNNLSNQEKQKFHRQIEQKEYAKIQQKIIASQAIEFTIIDIEEKIKKAKDAIHPLPQDVKNYLSSLINQIISIIN